MNWLNIAILLVCIGVASDNLVLAGLGGNVLAGMRKDKFLLILLFFFILQLEMLILGSKISISADLGLYGSRHVAAISFLVLTAALMVTNILTGKGDYTGSFKANDVLKLIFSTSLYVLVCSWAFHWLDVQDSRMKLILIPLVITFIGIGLFLGQRHYNRALKIFRVLSILLMLAGIAIIFYKTI